MSHIYLSLMCSYAAEYGKFVLCECLNFMSRSADNSQEYHYEH